MKQSNELVTKEYFDVKFNEIMEKLDWLIGKYKNHDEEHTIISGKLSEYNDKFETVEQKLGIAE